MSHQQKYESEEERPPQTCRLNNSGSRGLRSGWNHLNSLLAVPRATNKLLSA